MMARPSSASLNALADVLRRAQPLYKECRSILNYLDTSDEIIPHPATEESADASVSNSSNKQKASICLSVFESVKNRLT
jgi:hypothetical protein